MTHELEHKPSLVMKIRPVTTGDIKTSRRLGLVPGGKKGNGDTLSDTALGRATLSIFCFLKFGSSIELKGAATPSRC